ALARGAVAAADAKMADDDVVGADHQGAVGKRNAAAGRTLTGDGDARLVDDEIGGQADRAGDVEQDGAGAGGFDRGAQAAGAAVGEAGDLDDCSATAAGGKTAGAFGTRES